MAKSETKSEKKSETKSEIKKTETKAKSVSSGKIAAILLRGMIKSNPDVKATMKKLCLYSTNNCVVVDDNPVMRGMLKLVKDYLAYGKIDESSIADLSKRKIIRGKTYMLHPPVGGFERRGIKVSFKKGGALGERSNMGELIKKMV